MDYQDYDIIYRANGEVERIAPKNDKDYKLEELQEIVGGNIEIIGGRDGKMLVVDEEGKLKGKELNERATEWYIAHYRRNDYIVGDALLCKEDRIK